MHIFNDELAAVRDWVDNPILARMAAWHVDSGVHPRSPPERTCFVCGAPEGHIRHDGRPVEIICVDGPTDQDITPLCRAHFELLCAGYMLMGGVQLREVGDAEKLLDAKIDAEPPPRCAACLHEKRYHPENPSKGVCIALVPTDNGVQTRHCPCTKFVLR